MATATAVETKIRFEVRKGSFVRAEKAQRYGERLWDLSQKGMLETQAVVDDARAISSPIHDHFEWDDAIAGEAHRRQQARELIRSIQFVVEEEIKGPREVNAFFHIETIVDDERVQGYVNYEDIRASEDLRSQVITKARREAHNWRNRYQDYDDEFGEVFQAIDLLPLE